MGETTTEYRLCYRVPGDDPARKRVAHRSPTLDGVRNHRDSIIITARGTEKQWKFWIEARTVAYTEWEKVDG